MHALNMAMPLEYAAQTNPRGRFLSGGSGAFDFERTEAAARRFASVLASLGVGRGERVALLLPNTPSFVVCYYGTLKLGAIPVPLHPASPAPEVTFYLSDSEASVLVAAGSCIQAAADGFASAATCRHLIVDVPDSEPLAPPALRLSELLSMAGDGFETTPTDPNDVAVILYTSGTTGRPKGARLTHFNLFFFSQVLTRELWRLTRDDVMVMTAPAAHIFGQAILNVACTAGAQLHLLPRFEVSGFLKAIDDERVTFFAGVPALAQHLLRTPLLRDRGLGTVRLVMLGGAAVDPELMRSFRSRFGVDVITGFGMTEAVPVTFLTTDAIGGAPQGSVGRPVWGTRLRIVDEAGHQVPTGEPGEIVVRGPQVFQGYHNRPDETAAVWRDGWFRTGDIGRLDDRGYLFIVDRLKDMIKRSGYSVYPAEIERVLRTHDAVAEAAVVGIPDRVAGEEVKAFVVLKPGMAASADELAAHCRGALAAYKVPRLIEFRDDLPRNPVGKIVRGALRNESRSPSA
jgi:long-chain acyl-CoA synthetase